MLLSILHPSTGDEAIICSAYIWEPMNGNYRILSDGLQAAIQAGCPKGVTTVAGKLSGGHYSSFYNNFVNRLGAVIPVKAYKAPLNNWHSKVAIRLDNGRPVAAIIGSSNLTGPAYGLNMPATPYTPGWNYETDVLIWEGTSNVGALTGEDPGHEGLGYISAILDPSVEQPPEAEQLKFILQLVQNELSGFEPVIES